MICNTSDRVFELLKLFQYCTVPYKIHTFITWLEMELKEISNFMHNCHWKAVFRSNIAENTRRSHTKLIYFLQKHSNTSSSWVFGGQILKNWNTAHYQVRYDDWTTRFKICYINLSKLFELLFTALKHWF